MTGDTRIEKFPAADLTGLRTELMQSGIDSFQAAELITAFLASRGYGADPGSVREVVFRLEGTTCPVDCMQRELERVAYTM